MGRRITDTHWAYLAGLLDADGCFYFRPGNPEIVISGTNKKHLETIQQIFGGNVRRHGKAQGNWRQSWKWAVGSKEDISRVIDGVHPYLALKKERAFLLYNLLVRYSTRDHAELKRLNKRGNPKKKSSQRPRLVGGASA